MQIRGTPNKIIKTVAKDYPEVKAVIENTNKVIPFMKLKISDYQVAPLYALAQQFDGPDSTILEIGTAWGFSCAVLAQAAPQARIITLNPKAHEFDKAREHLAQFPNVLCLNMGSREYLWSGLEIMFDMVWVDGDHSTEGIRHDFAWFDQLKVGGLILFHDYTPKGAPERPCQSVYSALNEFRDEMGRDFDVSVIDNHDMGMVGYYRREEEAQR